MRTFTLETAWERNGFCAYLSPCTALRNRTVRIRSGLTEESIRVIEEGPFLSEEQKRDILYDNAARFFRLSVGEIGRHHGEIGDGT